MKKIIFLIFMLSFLFADRVMVMDRCNGRKTPKNEGTNNFVTFVLPNVYSVEDYYGDYAKIRVTEGKVTLLQEKKTTVEASTLQPYIEAYITTEILIKQKGGSYKIGGSGATLRSKPNKHSKPIGYIWKDSTVDMIKLLTTWIKVKNPYPDIFKWKQPSVWIYAGLTKPCK